MVLCSYKIHTAYFNFLFLPLESCCNLNYFLVHEEPQEITKGTNQPQPKDSRDLMLADVLLTTLKFSFNHEELNQITTLYASWFHHKMYSGYPLDFPVNRLFERNYSADKARA